MLNDKEKERFDLNFKGYWLDDAISNIPECSGVYIVYTCVYDGDSRTVKLENLIYIVKQKDCSLPYTTLNFSLD